MLQRNVKGFNVLAGKCSPHRLNRPRYHDRKSNPRLFKSIADTDASRLYIQGILGCFEQQRVYFAVDQRHCLLLIALHKLLEGNSSGYRKGLRCRTHSSNHIAGPVRCVIFVYSIPCKSGCFEINLARPLRNIIFGQDN
ncbi:hypothetical protein D3C74_417540 [compost metagenome]